MKKRVIISLSVAAALSLSAGTISVSSGWTLAGAPEQISISDIQNNSGCVKAVWRYDSSNPTQPWSLYHRDISSHSYGSINDLPQGSGFWVQGYDSSNCDISYGTTTPTTISNTYGAYGFSWTDVKSDYRYTVTDNKVDFNSTSYMFTLTANKNSGDDSRTEIHTNIDGELTAKARMKLTSSGLSCSAQIRTFTSSQNMTAGGTYISDSGVTLDNSTVYMMPLIKVYGKEIVAQVKLQDANGNYKKIYDADIGIHDDTAPYLNQEYVLKIELNGSILKFKAVKTDGTLVGDSAKTLDLSTKGIIANSFESMKLRATVSDTDTLTTSGDTAKFEVYYADAYDYISSPATTLTITNLETLGQVYQFEDDEDHWYGIFNIASGTNLISVVDYEYEGSVWENDENMSLDYTITDSSIMHLSDDTGFEADYEIVGTQQVTKIGTQSYTNLYLSDVNITVTASGTGETDTWDWAPTYYDGTQEQNVTTNLELKNMYLTNDNWFGGDNKYAMLSGSTSDTSGDVVKGVQDGLWDGCTVTADNDCKKIVRTTEVVGSWSYDSAGTYVDLPDKTKTLSVISDANSPTGYYVQSHDIEKVGTVWNEKILTGSDATQTLIQGILTD